MDEVAALLLLEVDPARIQFRKHESLLRIAGGFFVGDLIFEDAHVARTW
jgi:hypothetical protein